MDTPTPPRSPLDALAAWLEGERRLLEYLLYRLVSAKLLLAADERRFVPGALEEVEEAVGRLAQAESQREVLLGDVAEYLEIRGEVSLRKLVESAPEPWDATFRVHRDAFMELTDEIEETSRANSRLAAATLGQINRTLADISGGHAPATYDATGQRAGAGASLHRLDQVL